MFDLLIKNARVADGLGNPLVTADLAVRDGPAWATRWLLPTWRCATAVLPRSAATWAGPVKP